MVTHSVYTSRSYGNSGQHLAAVVSDEHEILEPHAADRGVVARRARA